METESNPYSTPVSSESKVTHSEQLESVDFSPILRRWEKLRLFYNAILVVFVFFLSFAAYPENSVRSGYWKSVCLGGLIANFCYFAGPTAEAYGTHFRLWSKPLTTFLFLAGLAFTALLASWCIANYQTL